MYKEQVPQPTTTTTATTTITKTTIPSIFILIDGDDDIDTPSTSFLFAYDFDNTLFRSSNKNKKNGGSDTDTETDMPRDPFANITGNRARARAGAGVGNAYPPGTNPYSIKMILLSVFLFLGFFSYFFPCAFVNLPGCSISTPKSTSIEDLRFEDTDLSKVQPDAMALDRFFTKGSLYLDQAAQLSGDFTHETHELSELSGAMAIGIGKWILHSEALLLQWNKWLKQQDAKSLKLWARASVEEHEQEKIGSAARKKIFGSSTSLKTHQVRKIAFIQDVKSHIDRTIQEFEDHETTRITLESQFTTLRSKIKELQDKIQDKHENLDKQLKEQEKSWFPKVDLIASLMIEMKGVKNFIVLGSATKKMFQGSGILGTEGVMVQWGDEVMGLKMRGDDGDDEEIEERWNFFGQIQDSQALYDKFLATVRNEVSHVVEQESGIQKDWETYQNFENGKQDQTDVLKKKLNDEGSLSVELKGLQGALKVMEVMVQCVTLAKDARSIKLPLWSKPPIQKEISKFSSTSKQQKSEGNKGEKKDDSFVDYVQTIATSLSLVFKVYRLVY
ncbi:hypothetical protein BGAL_0042g00060 [Botrytis galanthina]|uniref:Uncharacterized protein n=1 Tax=Botrytis galanthina TaxID=278940 RepID=A0A4S8R919_9HELO|nr:hypothetical protein BGAL_0042g00060 [Botrytis galanthina]